VPEQPSTPHRSTDQRVDEGIVRHIGDVGSCSLPVFSCGWDNGVNLYENEAMRTLVVLATLAVATGLAAPAYADPSPDATFLTALDKDGITYHSGPEAVAAARQVCDWVNQGQRRSDVIVAVSTSNPGFAMSSAEEFTTLAERAYCSDHPREPAAQPPPALPPSFYQIQFPIPTPGIG
jgi:Protein of unknown function (DUF732)